MTNETRYALINQEIATYQMYKNIIPEIMEIVREFDGKVINKRLEDALRAHFKDHEEVSVVYTQWGTYPDSLQIVVCARKDYVTENGIAHYIYNRSHRFVFPVTETLTATETGKFRVNADSMKKYTENLMKNLDASIETLQEGLQLVPEMLDEMKTIKNMMEKFNNKYSYRIREVFGCMYELRNHNSYEYL